MIVTNSEKGLATFDGKTSLATTKDYSRAVTKVSGNVVAFGGYNLEAAVAAATENPVEGLQGQIASVLMSIAGAFHSQNFSATATAGSLEARSSVSMDREGRYSVADFGKGKAITFATVDPSGVPITDQNRMSSLVLRLRAKAVGPVENVKDDIKTPDQIVEQKSAQEMVVTISARRTSPDKPVELPVIDPLFAADLKAMTFGTSSNSCRVIRACTRFLKQSNPQSLRLRTCATG